MISAGIVHMNSEHFWWERGSSRTSAKSSKKCKERYGGVCRTKMEDTMKAKKMIALAALILALCGCGTSAATSEQDSWDNDFQMEWIADEGSFEVYQDQETGVQYIVFWHGYKFGITPRYNADGSLYSGKEESHSGY